MSAAAEPVFAPAGWSVALHLAIAGLLFVGLRLPQEESALEVLPIDAVVVDQAVIQAANQTRREAARREAEVRRREEAQAQARREESARLEQEATRRVEEERRAEALQAKARADAEAKRKAVQQAEARAAAEKKRAADEARQRAEREADLRAMLAQEEEQGSAAFRGLKAEYMQAIQAHVEYRWFEPPGTGPGVSCTVHVMQIPGGEVVGMRFGACNGGEAMRRSIETAVRNASPLPAPPQPGLFEREVRLIFTPKERKR